MSVPTTVCEAFQETAKIDPDAIAIRTPGDAVTITWRDYAARVRSIAAGLAAIGVKRGDSVAIMLTNRPEFALVDAGAMHLGAIAFSIYNTSSPNRSNISSATPTTSSSSPSRSSSRSSSAQASRSTTSCVSTARPAGRR